MRNYRRALASGFREMIVGDFVCLRYYDAVMFKDVADTSKMEPIVRETCGWIEWVGHDSIRLVWERFVEPSQDENSKTRSTGLAIRKVDIIELKKIA